PPNATITTITHAVLKNVMSATRPVQALPINSNHHAYFGEERPERLAHRERSPRAACRVGGVGLGHALNAHIYPALHKPALRLYFAAVTTDAKHAVPHPRRRPHPLPRRDALPGPRLCQTLERPATRRSRRQELPRRVLRRLWPRPPRHRRRARIPRRTPRPGRGPHRPALARQAARRDEVHRSRPLRPKGRRRPPGLRL